MASPGNILPSQQRLAFDAFYESARNNTVLEPKTTLLIHIATAMAIGCYP
jgi:hypothetical protein